MIGTVWSQTAWANVWAPGVWADASVSVPAGEIGGGGSGKKKKRVRGGLLHEERYFAAIQSPENEKILSEKRTTISDKTEPRSYEQEDEELILAYMATLY